MHAADLALMANDYVPSRITSDDGLQARDKFKASAMFTNKIAIVHVNKDVYFIRHHKNHQW